MPNVNIKWGKKRLENVSLDPTEPLLVFKMQLWSLTGVPPERQKILGLKGGPVTDETILSDRDAKHHVKEGQQIMLMGTADAPPEAPKEKTVFVEDMADDEDALARATAAHPSGLANLGNTCYLNSTLQFLRGAPEVVSAYKETGASPAAASSVAGSPTGVVRLLGNTFSELEEKRGPPVIPAGLVAAFRLAFPQFAQQTPQGNFAQQDAQECLTQLVQSLKGSSDAARGSVSRLLEGKMESTLTCAEAGDAAEPETRSDAFHHLTCHIGNTTNHLHEGLEGGLEEDIEKRCEPLGRDAVFRKKSRIAELPQYLTVHFMRFFWKAKDGVKAKILRSVKFPHSLDVYNLCSESLKKEMTETRQKITAIQDKAIKLSAEAREAAAQDSKDDNAMDTEPKTGKDVLSEEDRAILESLADCDTGFYELVAVLTHQGRQADGGHYIAFTRVNDEWLKFDDDTVSEVTADDVSDLCGGGDRAMAYMCLYRRKSEHIDEPSSSKKNKDAKGKARA